MIWSNIDRSKKSVEMFTTKEGNGNLSEFIIRFLQQQKRLTLQHMSNCIAYTGEVLAQTDRPFQVKVHILVNRHQVLRLLSKVRKAIKFITKLISVHVLHVHPFLDESTTIVHPLFTRDRNCNPHSRDRKMRPDCGETAGTKPVKSPVYHSSTQTT